MANEQAPAPQVDKPEAAATGGKGGSALTADTSAAKETGAEGGAPATAPKPAWMAQLPADLQADDSLTKFKTIGDLGKSYRELEGKLGKSIMVPDEKASEEDRGKYRKAIGVPEKPEDYKLDKVELPEGVELDDDLIKRVLDVAHKNGVPQAAMNAVFKEYMTAYAKNLVDAMKLVGVTREECEAKLRAEYKGDYDKAMALKDRAFRAVAGEPKEAEELVKLMESTGLGNHPVIVKMFSRIGKMISEHAFVDGSRGQNIEVDPAKILYPNQN